MKVKKLKELLQERLEQIPLLKRENRKSQAFFQWRLETDKILEYFDKKCSTNFADSFSACDGYKTSFSSDELLDDDLRKASQHEKFLRDLDEAANLLQTNQSKRESVSGICCGAQLENQELAWRQEAVDCQTHKDMDNIDVLMTNDTEGSVYTAQHKLPR